MAVFVFHDYVHSSAAIYFALAEVFGEDKIQYVNARQIEGGILDQNPKLFVRPGGAARYGASKLAGKGYNEIKRYVSNGGAYLGICGGAYDACAKTVWAKSTKYEIEKMNDLDLFKADAIGPIARFADPRNMDGSSAMIVKITSNGEQYQTLYWGGSCFVPYSDANYVTYATFDDFETNNSAIVGGNYGEGRWLLSSVHIEMDHSALNAMTFDVPENKYEDITALGDTSSVSLDLFKKLLQELTDGN
jgi:glutamine amidotransferase-like uncharacterized protein